MLFLMATLGGVCCGCICVCGCVCVCVCCFNFLLNALTWCLTNWTYYKYVSGLQRGWDGVGVGRARRLPWLWSLPQPRSRLCPAAALAKPGACLPGQCAALLSLEHRCSHWAGDPYIRRKCCIAARQWCAGREAEGPMVLVAYNQGGGTKHDKTFVHHWI